MKFDTKFHKQIIIKFHFSISSHFHFTFTSRSRFPVFLFHFALLGRSERYFFFTFHFSIVQNPLSQDTEFHWLWYPQFPTPGHLRWETFGRICIMVTAVTARVKDHENNEILTKCKNFLNTVSFFSFITEWWQILKGRKAEGKEAWRAEDFWQNLKYSLFLVQGSCCS